jgi:hypothetical protein
MRRTILFAAIAIVALGSASDSDAKAGKSKAGHSFKGSAELQYRSNDNISIAPASGQGFDFASLDEFGIEDEDEVDGDEDEDEDEDQDEDDGEDSGDDWSDEGFDDLVDVDPDEDEIDEDDAIDEDGDGIDDLLDPDTDVVVDKESRYTAKIGLSHKYVFASESVAWNNAVRFTSDTHNQRDDLDKFNYALTSGFEFSPKGSKHAFKPSLSWVSLEKDNKDFVSTFVVSLAYTYEVSKRLGLGVTYNYQDKDLAKQGSPDSRVDTLAFSASFKATDEDIIKLKLAPKVEDSSQVTRDTDASAFEITYTRKLPWDMTAGIGYGVDSVEHPNLQPRRKDDSTTWTIQATKDFGKRFSMEVGYETRERESNIPNKDAENDSFYIGATYKF